MFCEIFTPIKIQFDQLLSTDFSTYFLWQTPFDEKHKITAHLKNGAKFKCNC